MKKLLLSLLATTIMSAALPASANVVTTLTETFASGATFTGQLTFADNYNGLLDVDGTLSGGPYGSIHFGWAWWVGTSQASPRDLDSNAATHEDWMMSGDIEGSFTHYIGLSWLADASSLSLVLSPNTSVYYAGINENDAAVSASTGNVPEPGSLALLGLGALAFGAIRRRRA